ncbi:hypothetical protein [Streptomyces sp. NPDC049906]|uniref:hypothetical protein n=1 Tax=Streptomyces sp. NPDC049906 TaxID=3155656 RepID=UPI003424F796
MAAERLCGGVLSKEAGKALEVITGVSRFEASGEDSTVRAAARALTREGESSVFGNGDICRIFSPSDGTSEGIRVTWELSNVRSKPSTSTSRFTLLPMGVESATASNVAFLTFACYEKEGVDSTPEYVTIDAQSTGRVVEPEGDAQALKDAYATLVHSFSLAMAKELGCKDNGGLKSKPSLTPA